MPSENCTCWRKILYSNLSPAFFRPSNPVTSSIIGVSRHSTRAVSVSYQPSSLGVLELLFSPIPPLFSFLYFSGVPFPHRHIHSPPGFPTVCCFHFSKSLIPVFLVITLFLSPYEHVFGLEAPLLADVSFSPHDFPSLYDWTGSRVMDHFTTAWSRFPTPLFFAARRPVFSSLSFFPHGVFA